MIKKRFKFTFPQAMIKEPVIYNLGKRFQIVTSLRRADIRDDMGWVVLELEGNEQEIQKSLDWVTSVGVRIDPVSGDIIEG